MLLQAIQDADFETYVKLTDSSITCFEPEAVRLSSSRPIRPDQSHILTPFIDLSTFLKIKNNYLARSINQGTRISSLLF